LLSPGLLAGVETVADAAVDAEVVVPPKLKPPDGTGVFASSFFASAGAGADNPKLKPPAGAADVDAEVVVPPKLKPPDGAGAGADDPKLKPPAGAGADDPPKLKAIRIFTLLSDQIGTRKTIINEISIEG
jgi:hypothetical protein